MNKRILITINILFIIALTFSACKKSNIKYGNKRIIGTWVHKSVKYTIVENYKETITFTTNDCGYENSIYEENSTSTVEINGDTVHEVTTETDIEDGETETYNLDTTYTKEQVYELTFNEDGTFTEKSKSVSNDENDSYMYQREKTGNWVWLDSYKEKQAVKLIYTYENWEGTTSFYSQIITIKSIDKENFVLDFIYDLNYVEEDYEIYDDDCNGKVIYETDREEEKETVEGTRTLEKK